MPIKEINPYLNFAGKAGEAISFYQKALGAEVLNVQKFGDVPGMQVAPQDKDRVMHAHLRLGAGAIMISDGPPGMPIPTDSNTHVSLQYDSPNEMTGQFDALAAGGQITMPLQDTFWGAKFGMLTDRYGIRWMFNCDLKKG
jgi:PhnB protein